MKYKLFILSCLLLILPFSQTNSQVFAEDDTRWCRITSENTYMHLNNPILHENSPCFKLPTTYFAKILGCADDYFKISFDKVVGYVKQDHVTEVFSSPLMPFPEDITFSINQSVQLVVFDYPSTSGKMLTVVSSDQKPNFLGETKGEEAILGLGTTWYYCQCVVDDKTISGFVYAPLTKDLVEICENTEEVLLTPASAQTSEFVVSPELLDGKNVLIIISLFIVLALLFLAIFIPAKKKKQTTRRVLKPPKFDDFNF